MSHHIGCNAIEDHPTFANLDRMGKMLLQRYVIQNKSIPLTLYRGEQVLELNRHGVENGWCHWPAEFDPIWVTKCLFFLPKEVNDSKFVTIQNEHSI